MHLVLAVGILLALQGTRAKDVVEPGPPTGIALQDAPGLLLTNCQLYTQRVYVRLDPWDVYRNHMNVSKKLSSDGRFQRTQTENIVEHARLATVHVLDQLQKFILTEEDLSGTKREKRFLGGLFTAVSAIGSLFSVGLSAANC